ncbi:MAG: heparinase II/III family protein, partial [Acidobacteriota bacterium]
QKRLYHHLPRLTQAWQEPGPPIPAPDQTRLAHFRSALLEDLPHLARQEEEVRRELAEIAAGRFTFLNLTIDLGTPDWNRRHGSHLWNFQLHYFPSVPAVARYCRESGEPGDFAPLRRLITDWIGKSRPGRSDGWDAYPVSLRTVNWIYGYALLADLEADERFLELWRGSIHRQLDYLSKHLELHLLANHLFKNVKALLIGGLFFDRPAWLAVGERLLWQEIAEQILPDGGHFERAPMYHAQTLADIVECLSLLRRLQRPFPDRLLETIGGMADFLEALSDPEGRLALFNDSANTPETEPGPIIAAARRLTGPADGPRRENFPETGYFTWQSGDGREKIVVDAGPPSVAYNTAHAHCDLLSFELRLDGRPWIVDTGVHGYGGDPYRHYCRSTRAHNTVMIEGEEQSEIWSTFRMGRMARLLSAGTALTDDGWSFLGRAVHQTRPDLV